MVNDVRSAWERELEIDLTCFGYSSGKKCELLHSIGLKMCKLGEKPLSIVKLVTSNGRYLNHAMSVDKLLSRRGI